MPTGYTADVQSGEVTEFAEFALTCARGMGALIMMRDDPMGAPIPEFQPSDYYIKSLERERAELERLQALTPDEAEAECKADYAQRVASHVDHDVTNEAQRERYEAMIAKVEAWAPPTPDHEGLKRFMLEQLRDSVRFDCGREASPMPPMEDTRIWLRERIKSCKGDIAYSERHHAEEVERANSRNEWVRQLRASLSAEAVDV